MKTTNWASNERARRNADVKQNRWNSPYAEKYDKMGGGNLYNDIAKGENAVERSNDTAIKAFNDKYKVGNDRFGVFVI